MTSSKIFFAQVVHYITGYNSGKFKHSRGISSKVMEGGGAQSPKKPSRNRVKHIKLDSDKSNSNEIVILFVQ